VLVSIIIVVVGGEWSISVFVVEPVEVVLRSTGGGIESGRVV